MRNPHRGADGQFTGRELDEKEIRRLADEGLSRAEILRVIGCDQKTLRRCLLKHGINPPSGKRRICIPDLADMVRQGLTRMEIAEHAGVNVSVVDSRLREAGLKARADKTGRQAVVDVTPTADARFAANPFWIGR